ncbi:MAG: bacillithiol system redox-active protein YtxJ [Bacteroidetes bacterium]|nr:bacillithiol system redox-active protein YtxJ [Bacteroidota bacterium]MBS1540225.1 bacillithiol system redox-active protein YtxJ [Bacteroidota bacterium]
MKWNELISEDQLELIRQESQAQPVLIFKHSTRCSISKTVLNRLERSWQSDSIKPYFLDLLSYRNISNRVAEYFHVQHESPQALLISQGQPVWVRSHFDIQLNELEEAATAKN